MSDNAGAPGRPPLPDTSASTLRRRAGASAEPDNETLSSQQQPQNDEQLDADAGRRRGSTGLRSSSATSTPAASNQPPTAREAAQRKMAAAASSRDTSSRTTTTTATAAVGPADGQEPPAVSTTPSTTRRWKEGLTNMLHSLSSSSALDTGRRDAAAATPLQDEPEFNPKLMRENMARFLKAIEPLEAAYVWLCEIQGWHNPYKTGLACLLYFYLAWHGLLLVGVITFVLAWFARGYLRATGQIRGPPAPPPEDNASDGSIRDKIKYLRKIMRNVQNWPAVVADHLEKGNNLLTWKVTANTLPLVQILGGVLVAVLVLPWPLVLMLAKILLGIKLFVVDSLYARFPEFKEKYDSTSRFWRELPCNRDLEGADAGGSGATTASADGAGTGAGLTRSQSDTVAARRKTSSTAAAAPATPAAAAGATASSRSSSSPTSQLSPPRTRKVRETDALLAKLGIHEDIVDSWTAVLVNRSSLLKSQHGRLYLTTNHLCFVRGSGEKDSGSFAFALERLQALSRTKEHSLMPGKGFSLDARVASEDGKSSEVHQFSAMINRDEAYQIICERAPRLHA